MRNLLYRTDFWDPASKGVDKGEFTHLPADLWHYTEKQTHKKLLKTNVQQSRDTIKTTHSGTGTILKWNLWRQFQYVESHTICVQVV